MNLSPNPERMRYLMRSPSQQETLKISPRNKYRVKRREPSGSQFLEVPNRALYHKKKRTEKFVRSETNHRVMTKAELAQWEKEAELKSAETQKGKLLTVDMNVRSAVLREKENVEFILNNETFELIEEEISPVPGQSKKRSAGVVATPLRLDLDVSAIYGNNLDSSIMNASTIAAASIIEPLTPLLEGEGDVSLVVPSGSVRSHSRTASSITTGTAPAKRYARRGGKRPTCKLSTITA